jgi:hypothetical protein
VNPPKKTSLVSRKVRERLLSNTQTVITFDLIDGSCYVVIDDRQVNVFARYYDPYYHALSNWGKKPLSTKISDRVLAHINCEKCVVTSVLYRGPTMVVRSSVGLDTRVPFRRSFTDPLWDSDGEVVDENDSEEDSE